MTDLPLHGKPAGDANYLMRCCLHYVQLFHSALTKPLLLLPITSFVDKLRLRHSKLRLCVEDEEQTHLRAAVTSKPSRFSATTACTAFYKQPWLFNVLFSATSV